jgi:hypothetical protein
MQWACRVIRAHYIQTHTHTYMILICFLIIQYFLRVSGSIKFDMYVCTCVCVCMYVFMYVDYECTYVLCMKYCLEVKGHKIRRGDETLRL